MLLYFQSSSRVLHEREIFQRALATLLHQEPAIEYVTLRQPCHHFVTCSWRVRAVAGLRIRIFNLFIKLLSCALYMVRVVFDDPQQMSGRCRSSDASWVTRCQDAPACCCRHLLFSMSTHLISTTFLVLPLLYISTCFGVCKCVSSVSLFCCFCCFLCFYFVFHVFSFFLRREFSSWLLTD